MRAASLAISSSLMLASVVVAASQNDPTSAYARRVQATLTEIATQTIVTHPQLLKARNFWLTCRIGQRGNVEKVQVLSRHRVADITETFAAALKSAKFPPIPKDVIKQRGENFLDVKTRIGIDE